MVVWQRQPFDVAPNERRKFGSRIGINQLMAGLYDLVERRGWRYATFACATILMVLGVGILAALEDMAGPRPVKLMVSTVLIYTLAMPCLAIAFKLIHHLSRTRAKLIMEVDRRILAEHQLRVLASTDELTGLSNRRHFIESGRESTSVARRYGQWCSFAIIDIDQFKQINDQQGHSAGDDALVELAGILNRNLRPSDLAARLGGDEFVVLMPLTDPEAALARAERIRKAVRQETGRLDFTVSIGVAAMQGEAATLEELMQRADQSLYAAKNAGRNQVIIDASQLTQVPRPAEHVPTGASNAVAG